MLNSTDHRRVVLDTFKLSADGIFLKDFHIERSLAAVRIHIKDFSAEILFEIYNKIENDFKSSSPCVGRLAFDFANLTSNFTMQPFTEILPSVILDLSESVSQRSGLGPQNYKWLDRTAWDQALALKSPLAHDILSLNELGHAVETSRYNLFFYSKTVDKVFTPPLNCGCVAGTYRAWALKNEIILLPELGKKPVYEMDIPRDQLKNYQVFVANSVRGVLSAKLLP